MKRMILGISAAAAIPLTLATIAAGLNLGMAQPAFAACTALPTDKGQDSFSVSISTASTYRVWTRMYAPSTTANGVYMQIDQAACKVPVAHSSALPAGTLTWVDWTNGSTSNKFNIPLSSGSHSVVLAGLDTGVEVDKVIFVSDGCTPTGDGTNCQASSTASPVNSPGSTPSATPTPVLVGSGSGTPPVSGTISLATSDSAATVAYKVDGKSVSGNQLDTTKLSDGTHLVQITETLPDGKTVVKTETITVHNGWQYKLVAAFERHWQVWSALAVGVIALVGVGGFWLRRWILKRKAAALTSGQLTFPAD